MDDRGAIRGKCSSKRDLLRALGYVGLLRIIVFGLIEEELPIRRCEHLTQLQRSELRASEDMNQRL